MGARSPPGGSRPGWPAEALTILVLMSDAVLGVLTGIPVLSRL
jgi:hypothetical protein